MLIGRSKAHPIHRIELRLLDLTQLFNSMDPTPFHHKDLDPDAEEFIENWALEFPADSRFHINIHMEHAPADGDPTTVVTESIRNFFTYKAETVRREVKLLLEQGRISLVIGVAFLVLCFWWPTPWSRLQQARISRPCARA